MRTLTLATVLYICVGFFAVPVHAQEVHQELQETVRAEVLEITEESERQIMGTSASTTVQTVQVRIKEGVREGMVVSFEND